MEQLMNSSRDYRALLRAYKSSVGFVDHQIKSFDEFIETRVQRIIDEIGEIQLETPELAEFKIKLGKVRIPNPVVKEADGATRPISPMEARVRDLTYSSPIFVEMVPVINGVEQESQEVKLGDLPIMLKSKLCLLNGLNREELVDAGEDPDDPGGYFIVNGTEKDKEMVEAIAATDAEKQEIYFNLYEFDVKTAEDAKEYIGKKLRIPQKEYRDKRINDIMDKYLLPHLGQKKADRMKKAKYMSQVVRKILKLGLEGIEEQDIDHYENKRLRMVADFMEILFRSILLGKYGLVSRIVYSYQKLIKRGKMPSIKSIVESDYLTKRIISHMATGQWIGGRTGVCQRLERTNHVRTIAHMRNVISPLSASQEHFEARALHATHWGRLCAEETPEGVNIGLRKYLAIFATITETSKDIETVREMIKKEAGEEGTIIFLNGEISG